VCDLNYTPTSLGEQSRKEITFGGMRKKKVEYHWYITLRTTGFVDYVHRPEFRMTRKNNILKTGCVSGEGRETPILLGSSEG
jgi:hypothetical protein